MQRDEYDALDAVSSTFLKNMAKSPAHAMAMRGQPSTPSQQLGQAKHLLALEPKKAAAEISIWAEGVRRGKAWDAFVEANAGKMILTAAEWEECNAAATAVRKHPLARKLLEVGEAEVPLVWEVDGIKAKSRLDWLAPTHIVDLKFTRDASPEGFPREAAKYGVPLQSAFYTDAAKFHRGQELPFFIVAVESAEPWGVTVWKVPLETIELGRSIYRRQLRQYEWCREKNEWPGYPEAELTLSMPEWAFRQEYEND